MLEIRDLKKRFGLLKVLDGVSLQIERGTTAAILGPNGSGKTTLIKSILGLVRPDAGKIFFQGENIGDGWAYRKHIGYLPQIASFPENLKAGELIHMIEDIRGEAIYRKNLIDLFGLSEAMNIRLKNLSGGTRQKVNILITFMFDSSLYVLDEPTSGLDPIALMSFRDLISSLKEQGKTILLTTHILRLAEEMADRITFLLEGKVYFTGSREDLLDRTGRLDLESAIADLMIEKNAKSPEVRML